MIIQSHWGTGKEARRGDSAGTGALVQPTLPARTQMCLQGERPSLTFVEIPREPSVPRPHTFIEQKEASCMDPGEGRATTDRSCVRAAGWPPTPRPAVLLTPPPRQLRVSLLSSSRTPVGPDYSGVSVSSLWCPSWQVGAAPGSTTTTLNKALLFRAHTTPPVCKWAWPWELQKFLESVTAVCSWMFQFVEGSGDEWSLSDVRDHFPSGLESRFLSVDSPSRLVAWANT